MSICNSLLVTYKYNVPETMTKDQNSCQDRVRMMKYPREYLFIYVSTQLSKTQFQNPGICFDPMTE
jgi:hypothetical protein